MSRDDYYRPQPPRSSRLGLWVALLIVLGILVYRYQPWQRSGIDPDAAPRPVTPRGDLAADEKTTIAIFREASPCVVHITTMSVEQDAFSLDILQIPQGSGSGFVWDQQGHIVTNFHVIQGADAAQVTLGDHSTWKARLVGAYPDKDLAVLLIEAPQDRLHAIPVGSSADLQVGQKVFAIGNPFGLDHSLTTGIISALGREIQSVTRRPIKDAIQTDAAINPGNSGGPLLDSSGRLIGVNTAIYSPSGVSAGIGFAIPADEVNRIVPQLIRHGKVVRPGLGIQVGTDQIAEELGVRGVLILGVQPDSAADKAGLRPTRRDAARRIVLGDVITAIDQQPITCVKDLFATLSKHELGSQLKLTVLRDGQETQIDMTLENLR